MKILSITAQKPHSTGSGVYLTELVNNWHQLGHRQAVVAGIYQEDEVHFPEAVEFYPVCYKSEELPFPITGMSDEMPYESLRYRDFSEDMLKRYRKVFHRVVGEAVTQLNPDVIVCHHTYLLTAMVREWYPDRKIIAISHGSDLRQIRKNPLQREYIKEEIQKLDGIIALHNEHKEEIRRIFQYPESQIQTIGIGYNQNIFFAENREEKPYYQLAFAGKVTEKKGIFSLLKALEKLPYPAEKILLKIAGGRGEDAEYQKIEKLAKESKYKIELLGAVTQQKLAEVFRSSDVFVLPSFFEGLPLVNIEALACGCKVVCSAICGVKEWYDENIPGCPIEFVELPQMKNTDEPLAAELPEFENRLSAAIQKMLEQNEKVNVSLGEISWMGISRKIVRILEEDIIYR